MLHVDLADDVVGRKAASVFDFLEDLQLLKSLDPLLHLLLLVLLSSHDHKLMLFLLVGYHVDWEVV